MWIQVRSMDGGQCVRIDRLSKLTKIEEIRPRLVEPFDAPPKRQRLFYRGKQLLDGYSLFDYNVKLNDIVQIMVQPELPAPTDSGYESCSSNNEPQFEIEDNDSDSTKTRDKNETDESGFEEVSNSCYYKIGDLVDARDYVASGTWFEAKIVKIMKKLTVENNEKSEEEIVDDDDFFYYVIFDGYEGDKPFKITFKDIRPRAHKLVKINNLGIGKTIMANYNTDAPSERGFWFDVCVTSVTNKTAFGSALMGIECTPLAGCQLKFENEFYQIEAPVLLTKRSSEMEQRMQKHPPPKRIYKPNCESCKDNPRRKCKQCACSECGGKSSPEKQILCDECDASFHIWCLTPPLESIPDDDEWYCPTCKIDASEVVRAGEKLKDSKKKSKMASAVSQSNRDWGKGMACVGRSKECTLVPPNHFGQIPNVPVGTTWKYRVQVSESGTHRPHVAGIHGRANEGAFSIVLAGGYEDDVDNGDEFTYTGSGGRDLSGNKRTAVQSKDQLLTQTNLALAQNCNVAINKVSGAEATNWKAGKPVRVIRSSNGKHKYAPTEGNRYDGLYKVVKYWPEKGKSGFLVWRYMFRRDDPNPAPWTEAGKKLVKKLGLTIQFPEGYLESKMVGDRKMTVNMTEKENKKQSLKRSSIVEAFQKTKKARESSSESLPPKVLELIKSDTANERYWRECFNALEEGVQFATKVEEIFMCICCQEVVYKPITTECQHNVCKPCLTNSFKADVYNCPACRAPLGKEYAMKPNKALREVLQTLLPGYESGRD